MKRAFFRIGALSLVLLIPLSLCACGVSGTPAATTTDATSATSTTSTNVGGTQDTSATVGTDTTDDTTQTTTGDRTATTSQTASTATTTLKPTTTGGKNWWEGLFGIGNPKPETTTTEATAEAVTTTVATRRPKATTTTTKSKITTTVTTRTYTGTRPTILRDERYANEHGIYHILKGYCYGKIYRTEEWYPVVGYVKDGRVQDTMYDATTIMPSPGHVYWGAFDTKGEWDYWVTHTLRNLDTLDRAARQVQEELELKEYKIKVFPTLVNPTNAADNPHYYDQWGKLDGVAMNVNNDDHRLQMLRYQIDNYIREIAARQYNNIELVGFYWFDEFVKEEDLAWYNSVTDYVRSKGLITMISAYYKATGWELCDDAGFDLHSMQSNYFPNGQVGIGNCGTERRLAANMQIINNGRIGGIETELDNHTKKDGITGFKMTMKLGVQTGIVNGYHVHYFGGGPSTPYLLSISTEAYYRSCYDELYAYLHNKLRADDVWIDPLEKEQERVGSDWV